MDFNIRLFKRNPNFYREEPHLKLNGESLAVVTHIPTKIDFVRRKIDLKECQDLEVYKNESILINNLKHKNLLSFVSSFVSGSHLWTIMPFAKYQSLADLSVPFGLSEEVIACVMKDVLSAVQYLHDQCIIHHSIRSSHILVFGSSKVGFHYVLSGLKYSINTIRNGEIVTPVYDYPVRAERILNWLAPEVLEQNLMGYTDKADIYSIGITCCELCNGSKPFAGLEASEVLLNKLNGETPEPLDSKSDDLKYFIKDIGIERLNNEEKEKYYSYNKKEFSKDFKNFVVQCCLHPEPEQRFSASKLLSHPFVRKSKEFDRIHTLMVSIRRNKLPENIKQKLRITF